MLELQESGRAMGADPSSWATTMPSAFAVRDNVGQEQSTWRGASRGADSRRLV